MTLHPFMQSSFDPVAGIKPHQPLTPEQCEILAIGSGKQISGLYSSTEADVAKAMLRMFGGKR